MEPRNSTKFFSTRLVCVSLVISAIFTGPFFDSSRVRIRYDAEDREGRFAWPRLNQRRSTPRRMDINLIKIRNSEKPRKGRKKGGAGFDNQFLFNPFVAWFSEWKLQCSSECGYLRLQESKQSPCKRVVSIGNLRVDVTLFPKQRYHVPRSKGKGETETERKREVENPTRAGISCSLIFPAAVMGREERRQSTGISHDALIKRTSLIRIVRLKRNHEQGYPFAQGFGGSDGRKERREADISVRDTPLLLLLFLLVPLSASPVFRTAVSTSPS